MLYLEEGMAIVKGTCLKKEKIVHSCDDILSAARRFKRENTASTDISNGEERKSPLKAGL